MHSCDLALVEMEWISALGLMEAEIWAVLHAENIKRGGEWIDLLLASDPRTNPWFQECGPWVIQHGDILGDDTDLVGSCQMCADMSRAWLVGDKE